MKWLPLKMNFLPLIFQEINYVTEEYIHLLSKIREKVKNQKENKSNSNGSQIDDKDEDIEIIIKKYNGLRESISKRINELENFYEDNIEDVRVSNFEKVRLRLKRLLMYNYENISRIEKTSEPPNLFIQDNNNMIHKKITEDTKRNIVENNISIAKKIIKEKKKEEAKAKNKFVGKDEIDKIRKKKFYNNEKKVIKVSMDEGIIKPLSSRKMSGASKFIKDIDNIRGLYNNDYSDCKEIIFRIKLNQKEYNTFLKEKKNKGNISPYLFK